MKRLMRRVVSTALACSLAVTPVMAYGAEFKAEPGMPYDVETTAKLEDNVMEYGEIEMLVETYNTTLKNMKESYNDNKDSMKDIEKVKDQIRDGSDTLYETADELSSLAASMQSMIGFEIPAMGMSVSPTAYGELVYTSSLLEAQAEQVLLSADQMTEMSPEMMRIQMVDQVRAALISGAQSAMNGYEQLLLQKESLAQTLELLEAVYQSTERQAAAGMATQNDVISAKQNLDSAKAGMMTIEANEVKIRQTLCTMLGWAYNASPEIPKLPAPDMSRIDAMNLVNDTKTATDNNFTLKYNRLSEDTLTSGSVEMQNLQRTMKAEEAEIASSMVNLYNAVSQAKSEYSTAQAAYELEQVKMAAADRKMSLGMVGRLEYLQQKMAHKTAEVNVRTAELALLQAVETYDWAVKGNLTLTQ